MIAHFLCSCSNSSSQSFLATTLYSYQFDDHGPAWRSLPHPLADHGKKVWLNAKIENDDGTSYTKTTAYKYMTHKGHFGNPQSKHEAAFEQIPELEKELNAVATKLAKCNIKPSKELSDFILECLKAAVEHQHMKGSKATWFRIVY
jgi:hypothetical protein